MKTSVKIGIGVAIAAACYGVYKYAKAKQGTPAAAIVEENIVVAPASAKPIVTKGTTLPIVNKITPVLIPSVPIIKPAVQPSPVLVANKITTQTALPTAYKNIAVLL